MANDMKITKQRQFNRCTETNGMDVSRYFTVSIVKNPNPRGLLICISLIITKSVIALIFKMLVNGTQTNESVKHQ